MIKGADISGCGRYRYRLWRWWDEDKPMACWIMLNPSTADADKDDPTIKKCIGFTKRWTEAGLHDCGGIMVVNLFALRATDPGELRTHSHPVTEEINDPSLQRQNDDFLFAEARACALTVAAWGNHGWLDGRGPIVRDKLKRRGHVVHHLGLTANDHPRHPGRIAYATPLHPWWSPRDELTDLKGG